MRIKYPSRVYDNILSHFEIDGIQKEDFNQDLSTTEYLEDLGPPPSNKVVICRYPNKNSKTDLDVSWLFTSGKLDSKELAWTLGVPWKPRRADPKGSYPGGGLNPDW